MSRNRFAVFATALTLALPMAAATAQAQVTQYTTLAAYLAAVSNAGTDTFDDLALGYLGANPLARTAGAYAYTSRPPFGYFRGTANNSDKALSRTSPGRVAFDSFDPTVRGIGGNFFFTNDNGEELVGDLSINWTEVGGTTGSATRTGATKAQFFGVVSSGGFTKFEVSFLQYEGTYTTVDNVVLGAAFTTVPEPSTYALMAAGLAALGFVSRRRRRALVA